MKKPISRKKLLLGLSALAVCVLLVILWFVKQQTASPAAYVYQSGTDYFIIRLDGSTVKLPETTQLVDYQFDPCEKYLYYIDHDPQSDDPAYCGALYRAEHRKLNGNSRHDQFYVQKIAESASSPTLKCSDDGRTILYRTPDDTLYVYSDQNTVQIAEHVTDAWFDENRIAYITSVSGCNNLCAVTIGAWDSPVLLAENYLSLITKDLDDLFYTQLSDPDTPIVRSLYRISVGSDPQHIAKIGFVANYGNRVYYAVSGPGYYNLHCYDNGNQHAVAYASGLGLYFPASHLPLYFNTTIDMSPTGTRLRFVNRDTGQVVRLSAAAAVSFRKIQQQYNSVAPVALTDDALFVADHALPSYTNISSLWVAPVQDDTTGDFTEITTDHRNVGTPFALNNTLYYMEKNPTSDITHFRTYRDGASTRILENVNRVLLYEDGSLLAYHGETTAYTLLFVDADGTTTTIAENVTKEWRISKEKVLYLRDGHLYEFDGNQSTLLAENASKVWIPHQMTPVQSWSISR